MHVKLLVLITLVSVLLVSCSQYSPTPSEVLVSTFTPEPSLIPSPTDSIISTVAPEQPTGTPDTYGGSISDLPVSVWRGIPVMSGAIMGNEQGNTYRYAISAAPANIRDFYEKTMNSLGWTLISASNQNGSVVLVYNKGGEAMKITITRQISFTLVVLARGG